MAEEKQLREQINLVVEAREKSRLLSDKRKSMYDAFTSQHSDFFSEVATAASEVGEAEAILRGLALETYVQTGEKTVAPGIGIRMMTRLAYENKDAMDWALEHKLALKLDSSAFEKMVKANPLSFEFFVAISEEPTATIATELQKVE